jgi:hypothetical protein
MQEKPPFVVDDLHTHKQQLTRAAASTSFFMSLDSFVDLAFKITNTTHKTSGMPSKLWHFAHHLWYRSNVHFLDLSIVVVVL